MANGANVNAADKNGQTPLMLASQNGRLETIKLLLANGANIEAVRKLDQTALMQASIYKQVDAVSLLLEKGANKSAIDSIGHTALSFASTVGFTGIVKLLSQGRHCRYQEAVRSDRVELLEQAASRESLQCTLV